MLFPMLWCIKVAPKAHNDFHKKKHMPFVWVKCPRWRCTISYCVISFRTSTPKDAVIIQNKKVCDQHLIYCLMEQLRFSGGSQSPPEGLVQCGRCVTGSLHSQLCWTNLHPRGHLLVQAGSQLSQIPSVSVHRTTLTAAPRASQSARLRRLLAIAFTLWAKLVFWQGRLGKKIMEKNLQWWMGNIQ